jgi:hypothetical protein
VTEFDLRSLLGALNAHGVEFVVIGGVAVGAHGFIRGTEDLDVVPDLDPDNLKRLAEALGAPSYSQLAGDAVESELLGVQVRVCSLARLREMKEAQGRTQDRLDLENLPER